ncbi:hypothetical protein C0993_003236, partial [Termitomyces sp. T159_Od127]
TSVALPSELFSPLVPQKVRTTFNRFNANPYRYPQYTDTSGTWQYFTPNEWSSGFFPATLYALNERSMLCLPTPANGLGMVDWLDLGRSATRNVSPPEPKDTPDHDRAFLISFLEELAINPDNTTARAAVVDFAEVLANRFNPVVGCTRSWDGSYPYVVIIDVVMNLEILILAANFTGNSTLYDMAISHADITMKDHVRDDGSTWQLVEYDPTTGRVVRKRTAQGYTDDSTWSRGQAWGIYGFANSQAKSYSASPKLYLETARLLADYFINHIPDDGIVPWDFDAPLFPDPQPADSSAAFIAAAALILLARYEIDEANVDYYTGSAIQVLSIARAIVGTDLAESLIKRDSEQTGRQRNDRIDIQ